MSPDSITRFPDINELSGGPYFKPISEDALLSNKFINRPPMMMMIPASVKIK